MIESLTLAIGLGIAAFFFIYFAFNLEEDHFILQLLLIVFAILSILLMAKVSVDDSSYCDIVLQNSTLIRSTNITTNVTTESAANTYAHTCFTNNNETSSTFYTLTLWFVRLFFVYVIVYFFYVLIRYKMNFGKEEE